MFYVDEVNSDFTNQVPNYWLNHITAGGEYIDQFVPVPTEAKQYERFYAKEFSVANLNKESEIKKFKAEYTVANVKKMIQSELGNNYMMLAVKGDILNSESDEAIVLSQWGEGISEETKIALGVQ